MSLIKHNVPMCCHTMITGAKNTVLNSIIIIIVSIYDRKKTVEELPVL